MHLQTEVAATHGIEEVEAYGKILSKTCLYSKSFDRNNTTLIDGISKSTPFTLR